MADAMTGKQRQKEFKARVQAEGFKRVEMWVHKSDAERVQRFRDTLRKPDACDRHNQQPGRTGS